MKTIEDKGRDNLDASLAEAQGCDPQEVQTDQLAAMGGEYILGTLTLNVTPGRIMLLEKIDSPFLGSGDGDENDTIEFGLSAIAKALYVLAIGAEAVQPIMNVEAKLGRLKTLEKMAEKRPEYFKMYMDKIIEITAEETELEINAIKFYEEYMNGVEMADAGEFIMSMIKDAFEPMSMMPEQHGTGSDSGVKKN